MLRIFHFALVLASVLMTGPPVDAQGFPPNNFPGLSRPGPGLAPLRPMLGLPPPGLNVHRFPGLGHPNLQHPAPPRSWTHRSFRRPHAMPRHFRSRFGLNRKAARPLRRHAYSTGPRAAVVLPPLRLDIGRSPPRPFVHRRDRRPDRAFRRDDFTCTGGTCTLTVDEALLAEKGVLVCVVATATGRCARFLRVVEP